jgi:hypothetical protein
MVATYRDAQVFEDPACYPSVPRQASAQKFFPNHQVRPVLRDAVCTDDFHLAQGLADALAGPDVGRLVVAGFPELCLAPVRDCPCAVAWADVVVALASAGAMADPVLPVEPLPARLVDEFSLLPAVPALQDEQEAVVDPAAQVRQCARQFVAAPVPQALQRVASLPDAELVVMAELALPRLDSVGLQDVQREQQVRLVRRLP